MRCFSHVPRVTLSIRSLAMPDGSDVADGSNGDHDGSEWIGSSCRLAVAGARVLLLVHGTDTEQD